MKSSYRHQKGQINDNALQALLHDPLFKVRVERNKKGKGSYQRQEKHGKGKNWGPAVNKQIASLPLALLISVTLQIACLLSSLNRQNHII